MAATKRFKYVAIKNNKNITGYITAKTVEEAVSALHKKKYTVLDIIEAPQINVKVTKLNQKELYFFAFNMANFIDSGFNVIDALNAFKGRSTSKKIVAVIDVLVTRIKQGESLSEAMKNTKAFPPFFVSIIRGGESTGNLVDSFEDIAVFYQTMINFKSKVTNAVMYPASVFGFSIIAIFIYLIAVFPTLSGVYSSLGADIPFLTRVLMNFAASLRANWPWYLLFAIIFFAVMTFAVRKIIPVKIVYEKIKMKLPVLNKVFIYPEYIKFAKILKDGYASGLPIIEVLDLSREVFSFYIFSNKIAKIRKAIMMGAPIGETLEKEGFDPLMCKLISLGEESGMLKNNLDKYSKLTENEFNAYLSMLSSLLEPITIVIVGGFIGLIVVSLYYPMFNLVTVLLGGVK